MRPILYPEAMAAADAAAIRAGTSSLELMERAGFSVAAATLHALGRGYGARVMIVCGKGNNAGDGFVAARYLARAGGRPEVVILHPTSELKGDSLSNFRRLGRIGVKQFEPARFRRDLGRADAVVDAIVGTGSVGPLRGIANEAVQILSEFAGITVAVDVPSGVNASTGSVEGPCVKADVTVTMAALKPGLLLLPGTSHAGEIEVADIGIDAEHLQSATTLTEAADVARLFPPRPPTAHKRNVGKVLVVGGSRSMPGAASLTALGAYRAGAGLVRMAVPQSVAPLAAGRIQEALVAGMAETPAGAFSLDSVGEVGELSGTVDSVAIGPGIGRDDETGQFLRKLLPSIDRPVVLDADGISLFAGDTKFLRSRSHPTLLTPHEGELGRLLGIDAEEVAADRIGSARRAAEQTRAFVLLKGFRSLVASPDGDVVIIDRGGPVLATAGSGDVLTGIASALAARVSTFEAGWGAAWVHAASGDAVAAERGAVGGLATDFAEALPGVIRELADG